MFEKVHSIFLELMTDGVREVTLSETCENRCLYRVTNMCVIILG